MTAALTPGLLDHLTAILQRDHGTLTVSHVADRWYASTQIGKGHLHTAMAGTLPAALNQLTEQLR